MIFSRPFEADGKKDGQRERDRERRVKEEEGKDKRGIWQSFLPFNTANNPDPRETAVRTEKKELVKGNAEILITSSSGVLVVHSAEVLGMGMVWGCEGKQGEWSRWVA